MKSWIKGILLASKVSLDERQIFKGVTILYYTSQIQLQESLLWLME